MRAGMVVAVLGLVGIAGCSEVPVGEADGSTPSGSATPSEVETFDDLSRDHVTDTYDYPHDPPVGGPHDPAWQNCGFYEEPVVNEHAVHSLEHGAVWITYQPGLDEEQLDTLRTLAASDTHVLVSPYDGLPSPVVATAWGVQLELPTADDPALEEFLGEYVRGEQTPEPGAPCSGGVGEPTSVEPTADGATV